jgi:hypothetical protein
MELISSVTVGSGGAASIDFTAIPQTYTDLTLLVSARMSTNYFADNFGIRFNGTTSTYSERTLRAIPAVSSASLTGQSYIFQTAASGATATASTFGSTLVTIPNYAGSANKTVSIDAVSENNGTDTYRLLTAGLWSSTSAITSITLVGYGAPTFQQYSTAYLYGTLKGSGGATVS